ncbi:AAA family ATPase [Azoarcus sp. TTM-91]|uniref:XrtA-associated tyrosine autokinase n=1 Tax=Azoarcus sp. TTM-91 TaxID=2691581 RepID=UPI00145E60FA|nr:XrtA-associated tyrosine autokinase [Azoarcus sp. TTM-91]NMG33070.1 AAA family ATPase [Azoarcus sp. TTM-91]
MSLIEKAVQRLDQLKQAGGEVAPSMVAAEEAQIAPAAPSAGTPAPAAVAPEAPVETAAPASRSIHIDLGRLAQMGMVTPDQPRSPLAEEYRVIKRPLLRNAQGLGAGVIANGNLIMVTSALPGEGKSFSAINLAISMAMELDHTVLLVDADVSRPSVLNRLGLPPQRGLMDVLSGDISDLGDVLLRTNIEKLSLLPAGMPHQRATELLASDAMNRMLEQMATRYADRVIVFDSPPLLVTTEARVLATHMGQVVIVVEAAKTTHATIKQALSTIENCPVKLMVLNKARERGAGGYYGYGYGYGYGSDARSEAA